MASSVPMAALCDSTVEPVSTTKTNAMMATMMMKRASHMPESPSTSLRA